LCEAHRLASGSARRDDGLLAFSVIEHIQQTVEGHRLVQQG